MVSVIGAGIAGLSVATGLARAGIPVTVYERRAGLGDGAFLALGAEAHSALVELGVSLGRLHAASYPIEATAFTDTEGKHYRRPADSRQYLRRDLLGVLSEAAEQAGVSVNFDVAVNDVRVEGAVGRLSLGDGGIVSDELVVAADGIDSRCRDSVEPDRVPVYGGQNVIYGWTDTAVELVTDVRTLHFHVQRATDELPTSTFGHIHQGGESPVLWFARITAPAVAVVECGRHPVQDWADRIRCSVPEAHVVAPILAATSSVHVTNARNVPIATTLAPTTPVVLIGDADHAITPAAGSGAGDAIADAAAVVAAIVAGESPVRAIRDRRTAMREFRERIAHIPGVSAS